MLAQLFEHLFHSVDSMLVTNIFIWAVILIFFSAWWCDYKNIHSKFREYAPTLMGALGILGTFIGIIIGLLNFNTESIDTSIPVLLGGLKTAFITSIVGMFFAIAFNALDAFFFANKRNKSATNETEIITPDHIHHELKEQNQFLEKLVSGMSGSEEGSLVAQIKLLRNEINDASRIQLSHHNEFSNKLWEQLQQFADLMAKGATEKIIDALRQVITDFNEINGYPPTTTGEVINRMKFNPPLGTIIDFVGDEISINGSTPKPISKLERAIRRLLVQKK